MQNITTRADLISDLEMKEKFGSEYPAYQPDLSAIESLKSLLTNVEVTVVVGTWCSDSQQQLPQFLKVLDMASFDGDKLKLIGVDRSKSAQDGSTDGLQIAHVPTFIFSTNNIELGRITELPITTLENDMVTILTQ